MKRLMEIVQELDSKSRLDLLMDSTVELVQLISIIEDCEDPGPWTHRSIERRKAYYRKVISELLFLCTGGLEIEDAKEVCDGAIEDLEQGVDICGDGILEHVERLCGDRCSDGVLNQKQRRKTIRT